MRHAEPTAAGEEEKPLPVSGKWKQTAALAHVSQVGRPQAPVGSAVVVFPGRCLRACPHSWEGEDHDGLNEEATCQVGLTSEDTGTQPPGGLSPLFASCLDIDVLAEAALCGRGKEPQVGFTWSWRTVERELRAVSLFGDP